VYVCHVIPFIQPNSPFGSRSMHGCDDPQSIAFVARQFLTFEFRFWVGTPGKMPAGEGPGAACAVFKACGDSTKTTENMHLPARFHKQPCAPKSAYACIALTLWILPLAQEAVRALARVRRIKSSIVSAGPFLTVDR